MRWRRGGGAAAETRERKRRGKGNWMKRGDRVRDEEMGFKAKRSAPWFPFMTELPLCSYELTCTNWR